MNILVYHPYQKKQVKPKNSSITNHLLFCNHSASYGYFIIVMSENKKILLELKDSLSVIKNIPYWNMNISAWAGLLALIVLLNLFSSWSLKIATITSLFTYCHTCTLNFFSTLKLENGLKKYVRHIAEIKYGFLKSVLSFLYF